MRVGAGGRRTAGNALLHTLDLSPAGGTKLPSSELTELKEDAPLLLLALLCYAHTTNHGYVWEGCGDGGEG